MDIVDAPKVWMRQQGCVFVAEITWCCPAASTLPVGRYVLGVDEEGHTMVWCDHCLFSGRPATRFWKSDPYLDQLIASVARRPARRRRR